MGAQQFIIKMFSFHVCCCFSSASMNPFKFWSFIQLGIVIAWESKNAFNCVTTQFIITIERHKLRIYFFEHEIYGIRLWIVKYFNGCNQMSLRKRFEWEKSLGTYLGAAVCCVSDWDFKADFSFAGYCLGDSYWFWSPKSYFKN